MQRASLGQSASVWHTVVQKPPGQSPPDVRHFCAQSLFAVHSAPSERDTPEPPHAEANAIKSAILTRAT